MIRSFLDISTAHLCPATRAWLDGEGVVAAAARTSADPEPALVLGSTPYGWFVYADPEACTDPAAMAQLIDRRDMLSNASPGGAFLDGLARAEIERLDEAIRAVTGDSGPLIPDDLWACMARARAAGCDYIMFDADAEIVSGLPTFPDAPTATTPVADYETRVH